MPVGPVAAVPAASRVSAAPAVSSSRLRRLIARDGGFTVARTDGTPARAGISVCTRPSRSLAFDWLDWDDHRVDAWLRDRATERVWPSPFIGGWLDPRSNTVWLDVVRVVPSRLRPAACLIGRAMGQHCVFDLGRGETLVLRAGVA